MEISKPLSALAQKRLRKAIANIEADPTTWDQLDGVGVADCGTTGCLAGHLWANSRRLSFRRGLLAKVKKNSREEGLSTLILPNEIKDARHWNDIREAAMRYLEIDLSAKWYLPSTDWTIINDRIFNFMQIYREGENYIYLNGHDTDPPPAAERIAAFKARITEVTGMEF